MADKRYSLGVFLLIVSSFLGGLFLGYLGAILAFFVWRLIKEGFDSPKQMLLGVFYIGIQRLQTVLARRGD